MPFYVPEYADKGTGMAIPRAIAMLLNQCLLGYQMNNYNLGLQKLGHILGLRATAPSEVSVTAQIPQRRLKDLN